MLKAFKSAKRKFDKETKTKIVPIRNDLVDGVTHFIGEYEDLYCGQWICSDNGIYCMTMFGESWACPHPILITKNTSKRRNWICKSRISI